MTPTSLRFTSRLYLAAFSLLLALHVPSPAQAQSTEPEVLAQLKGKPLYLRGLWRQDDLRFTHEGKPVQPYASDSFTLASIDAEGVRFTPDTLEIEGHRVGLEFTKKDGPRRVRLKWRHYSGKIVIHVAGHSGEDFGPAMAAIFAPDLPTLIPSQEQYWARVGILYQKEDDLDQAVDEAADEAVKVAVGGTFSPENDSPRQSPVGTPATPQVANLTHVGGSVKPPTLLSQVDPSFSDAARGMRYSGNVEVRLWVEPSGLPTHLQVVRPAGLGLDERALAAVSAYRFTPAIQNGKPVIVDLYVDVNFRIF